MIIFVAGIHGVGKTFLGVQVAAQFGIRHATASQLIREESGMESWSQDKRVNNVDDNQAALISAVARMRANGESLLLDGHFVLRGANGAHIEISEAVFRGLGIDAILLLECDPDVIIKRLNSRGDASWSREELCAFAHSEKDHATAIAESLGVQIHCIFSPDETVFKDKVKLILGG